MLKRIICDKFKQRIVDFKNGLNTVLGDDVGTNSIGKSTFLLIVDFAFGGSSYNQSTEVFKNIGHHAIKICFEFNSVLYYFQRKTEDSNTVYKCDENYTTIATLSLEQYNEFLYDKYSIDLFDLKFRGVISLYSRIYGKDNLDEKHPLSIRRNEPEEKAVISLIKLFDLYRQIAEINKNRIEKKERYKAFVNAQKHNVLPKNITKKTYKENCDKILILKKQCEDLQNEIGTQSLNLKTEQLEQVRILMNDLSIWKRQRSKANAMLVKLENNKSSVGGVSNVDLEELIEFFPNVNTEKIEKVNQFHSTVSRILSKEIGNQITQIKIQIEYTNEHIDKIHAQIQDITKTVNPSKIAIQQLIIIQKQIAELELCNNFHDDSDRYKLEKTDTEQQYNVLNQQHTNQLSVMLNKKMDEINDFIYSKEKMAPSITFNKNRYIFSTPDDRGTGTSYKNMIVYDLSILEMTKLPILIHDSVVLKQVADTAIDKIMEKYSSYNKKQIFIALDKRSSYLDETKKILSSTTILELSPKGNELFGCSWNNK